MLWFILFQITNTVIVWNYTNFDFKLLVLPWSWLQSTSFSTIAKCLDVGSVHLNQATCALLSYLLCLTPDNFTRHGKCWTLMNNGWRHSSTFWMMVFKAHFSPFKLPIKHNSRSASLMFLTFLLLKTLSLLILNYA
jgi:hypothetical protein